MDINPKFINAHGLELVLLTKSEYEALITAAAEAEEDAADIALYDERKAALARGEAHILPVEVSQHVMRGDRLLTALRKWRRLTPAELCARAGVSEEDLLTVETGSLGGSMETLAAIARALDVPLSWITPD